MAPAVIAVDGAAGSGKSTLSRSLAAALQLPYINTGLMYRAIAAAALQADIAPDDVEGLDRVAAELRFTLAGNPPELEVEGYGLEELASAEVEAVVSTVSRHPAVRRRMRDRQRELGRDGAVMEGRDIATVVFPDAAVKLFLRAGERQRGRRRADERAGAAESAVAAALRARDLSDAKTTPLEPAPGAVVIDTDRLDVAGTFDEALRIVHETLAAG
jgi:cytidylate kinase